MAIDSLSICCQPVCIYHPACLLGHSLSVYLCTFLTVGSLSICCQPVCIYHPACLLGCRLSVYLCAFLTVGSLSICCQPCLLDCRLSVIPTAAWLLAACQSAASLSVCTILSVCQPLRLFGCCLSVGPLHSYINVCLIFLIFLLQK